MNYGFIPSKMDGTEDKFKKLEGFKIPEEYSYKKYLPKVVSLYVFHALYQLI